ncbi:MULTISPECIES: DUF167 family protein [unclassified Devosia]|uniref:DUF167 family protein n=1 Tax=unclassified Devosia TaxID=196773 RepID=UPI0023D7FE7E|nr:MULTISPECIES: DUF167 family protein [unclassified Devosia]WEJ33481.1 DUF167 family protein [Devosia sp. SD17-2]
MTPEGLLVFLRVTPNAGRDSIDGVEIRDDASIVLRVRVSAVPDKGKANAAVIALLAKALRLPKSAMTLVSGDTSRHKTILVSGDGVDIAGGLATLVAA